MFGGYNNGRNYGPMNALADIFSAYTQKQQENKAYADYSKYADQINNTDLGGTTNTVDMASRANPMSNYMGKNVEQQTMQGMQNQGLLSNPNWLNNQPTSDNLGKGLLSGMQQVQQQGQQKTGLLSRPQQPQQPQAAIEQQYSFTNPLESPNNPYAKANNPVQQTTAPAMTLAQAKKEIYGTIPTAMRDLVQKYGVARAREIMPLIQQTANDKLAEYTDQYNRNKADSLMQQFNTSANPMQKAMIAAQMKQYGIELDPKMISTLSPDYKLNVVDQGDRKSLVLMNPKDGQVLHAGALGVNVSPDTEFSQKMQNYRHDNPSGDAKLGAQVRLATYGSRGGGGRGNKLGKADTWAQNYELNGLNRDQATLDEYNQALESGFGLTPELQRRANQASANMNQYWKFSSGGEYDTNPAPTENYLQADAILNQIRAQYPDATEGEIFQYLHNALGYGG